MTFLPRGGLVALNPNEEFVDERCTFGFFESAGRMVRRQGIRVDATPPESRCIISPSSPSSAKCRDRC